MQTSKVSFGGLFKTKTYQEALDMCKDKKSAQILNVGKIDRTIKNTFIVGTDKDVQLINLIKNQSKIDPKNAKSNINRILDSINKLIKKYES